MKSSPSVLGTSFSVFSELIRNQASVYGWYLLCRFLELIVIGALAAGLFMLIGVEMPGVFMGGLAVLVVVAFLLESWFTFCLYRGLDENGSSHSLGMFLHRGRQQYWATLGKYILLGIMWAVLFYGGSGLVSLLGDSSAAGVLAWVLIVIWIYLGVPLLLTFYEVVIRSAWPWSTLKKVWTSIRGMWWRIFGSLFVWTFFSVIVYTVLFALFSFIFLSASLGDMAELFQGNLLAQLTDGSANIIPGEITTGVPEELVLAQPSELEFALGRGMEGASMDLGMAASLFFSSGMFLSLLVGMILFVIASIVPIYGYFSVYKAVEQGLKK